MIGRRGWMRGALAMTVPGLGGQQQPPPNSAPAAQLVPGVQPGTTAFFSQLRAGNTIVNKNGIFVYNPKPAAGNLVASLTPVSGTDLYGNAYLQGVTSYFISGGLGLALASQSALGGTLYYTGPASLAGPWTEQAGSSNNTAGGFSFITGGGATGGSVPQPSAGITTVAQVVAALINAGVFS